MQVYNQTGESFIFILDEWDYIFNNKLFTNEERESFLQFLKDLLKDKPYVELAYMTGVLPIAKYSSGSALNMFKEYNMMNDNKYDKYFGFTQKEVEKLCSKQSKITMNELTDWYNGYRSCGGLQIYNPRSVCYALSDEICQSYWTNTGPMDEISRLVLKSNEMLEATIKKDTETMEKLIQEAHDINIPIIKYNNENSLACVITLVYLNARTKYKIVREMQSGIGFADFIFYPNDKSKPAFILELKKDSTPEEALKQIHEKRYALALKDYTGKKLAVGISYDSKLKNHKVKVEEF